MVKARLMAGAEAKATESDRAGVMARRAGDTHLIADIVQSSG